MMIPCANLIINVYRRAPGNFAVLIYHYYYLFSHSCGISFVVMFKVCKVVANDTITEWPSNVHHSGLFCGLDKSIMRHAKLIEMCHCVEPCSYLVRDQKIPNFVVLLRFAKPGHMYTSKAHTSAGIHRTGQAACRDEPKNRTCALRCASVSLYISASM